MNLKKFENHSKKDFIKLIMKLNTKIVYYQRKASKNWSKWKTMWYKCNIAKQLILDFLKSKENHILDEIPSIKEITIFELRKRLQEKDDNA